VLLGILLFVCFVPVYSMAVIAPVTFFFGSAETLYKCELAGVYILAAATAVWLISRLWNAKPPVKKS
jgi:hypothetical protein